MNNNIFKFLQISCLMTSMAIAFPAGILAATPEQSLEGFKSTVLLMEFPVKDAAHHADLVKKASSFLDLDTVGQRAMVEHWAQLSDSQRQDFLALFSKLIEAIAYKSSNKFFFQANVTYSETKTDTTGFVVKSLVRPAGEDVDVEVIYHLSEKAGELKIDDVFLDGVSIVEDLKYQFDKVIAESQFDGLIKSMNQRLTTAVA